MLAFVDQADYLWASFDTLCFTWDSGACENQISHGGGIPTLQSVTGTVPLSFERQCPTIFVVNAECLVSQNGKFILIQMMITPNCLTAGLSTEQILLLRFLLSMFLSAK